ncbi:UDP-N-acetylglucosamine 4,6-dehydratase (configuration-retaining) [Sulfurospirillum deleyianum]|uniref:Polysaccharide biosynthesis protein CapD n=1 Tax=Sulfurospirillum deleyianum (strain ATCC 51133 / DSM 6946 / 5175) TaxID=525898 RepID=D1B3W4_SULD5|nr:UDP-N-acetylglucosamine 4,6-dehydratase (configuration-retaining) [Sulfurospirillum deleyianum]ACZ12784.1 polysaccharide biosynthesis protein CapD [Sulfurospirillum deleyianum DSM 6946]
MMTVDKRILNILVIVVLSCMSFVWTFWIFHLPIQWSTIGIVIAVRIVASIVIFKDFSLSWSKVTQKTFLMKSFVYIVAFCVYVPFYYGKLRLSFMLSELFLYLFSINFLMYAYYLFVNRSHVSKEKNLVIYGAGKAGLKLAEEFRDSQYKIRYFVDDNTLLQKRSIDAIRIISKEKLKQKMQSSTYDLLLIAIPSAPTKKINALYEEFKPFFSEIKILPTLENILSDTVLSNQLKNITVEDLLARHPQDLDKVKIGEFIHDKVVLITGAGGSIGSEIVRQCLKYNAKKLILVDHSEFNLYQIIEELHSDKLVPIMQSVLNESLLEDVFHRYRLDIVVHAAAYKHVPLVEANPKEGILNNILGTKICIDLAIKYEVGKFILISTDKAVRPTNVMGATKRVCELYAQNVDAGNTHIVAVRFGNVLGSSGSVIPKFKAQIEKGGPITVTHPDITRYFMLIPEACELVLQTGAIGRSGELFILDMGEPVKIVDLAQKMIELSGKNDITIEFTGLRPGEKLYEELLINESDKKTEYTSILVAHRSMYPIEKLEHEIATLFTCKDILAQLKHIVPEFNHQKNI